MLKRHGLLAWLVAVGLIAIFALSLANFGVNSASGATITCGSAITSSIVLAADLQNCSNDPNCNYDWGAPIAGSDCYGLVIEANGITLDCQQHSIRGSSHSYTYGIYAYGVHDVAIRNCYVANFDFGIFLSGVTQSHLSLNNVTNSGDPARTSGGGAGIRLFGSSNNTLVSNRIAHTLGVGGAGSVAFDIALSSKYNVLQSNFATDAGTTQGGYGFNLSQDSTFNNETANVADTNGVGFEVEETGYNVLYGNSAVNNDIGTRMLRAGTNRIYNNKFSNNRLSAIETDLQDSAYGSTNVWNTTKASGTNVMGGPFIGGNFWSDYTGVDQNGDGIGDTSLPYTAGGNITSGGDFLPLVQTVSNTPHWTVSLDASSFSSIDANPQNSATQVSSFRVGAIVNASGTSGTCGTRCLQNVYSWQFGIVYDNTTLIPQGDPILGNPADTAADITFFGAQAGSGNPNWASMISARNAFGIQGLVDPKIDNHHNEIQVAFTVLGPNPGVNIFTTLSSTVKGNLLASVMFEILQKPSTPISLTIRDVEFFNVTIYRLPNISPGTPIVETITNSPPIAKFAPTHLSADDPSCAPITGALCTDFAYSFDGSSSSDSDGSIDSSTGYYWDFGDGTQDNWYGGFPQGAIAVHDYGVNGTFVVTLRVVDDKGATGSARDFTGTAIVNSQPSHLSHTIQSGSGPLLVTVTCPGSSFTAGKPFSCTVEATGGVAPYSGTGTFSLTQPVKGTYTETFTVTDATGATATGSDIIVFTAQPLVANVACDSRLTAGKPFTCNVSASGGTPPYTGTGSFSVTQPVKGEYLEAFTVTDANQVSASGSASVTMDPQPLVVTVYCPTYQDYQVTAGKPFPCRVSATGGTQPYNGIGDFSAGPEPAKGVITESFSVSDANGLTASGSTSVTILPQPMVVNVTCPSSGLIATVTFDCNVWATGGTGPYSGSGTLPVTEPKSGSYEEEFRVTDSNGQSASGSATVNVADHPPVAKFASATTAFEHDAVSFNASGSFDPDGNIINYTWTFGDNTASGGAQVSHSYLSPGNYTVTLTVTDDGGITAATSTTVIIADRPPSLLVTENRTSATRLDTITLTYTSTDDEPISSVTVNWGDGAVHSRLPANGTDRHTYSKLGDFNVTVTATDVSAVSASKTIVNTIRDVPPNACFTQDATITSVGRSVSFSASCASDVDGTIVSYSWNFGDGTSTPSGINVNHAYSTGGAYIISLQVTDNDGSVAVATSNVAVLQPAIALTKTAHSTISTSGSANVTYDYQLCNTGNAELTIDISDNILGTITPGDQLVQGECKDYIRSTVFTISTTNVATAMGVDVLGDAVNATATATVTIANVQGGTLSVDQTSLTGVSTQINGSTDSNGTAVSVASTDLGSNQPNSVGKIVLGSSQFFDVQVSGLTSGIARICISNTSVSEETSLQYWNPTANGGAGAWLDPANVTITNNQICGDIPVTALNGTAIVTGKRLPGDVNEDGKVDIFDLVKVAIHFGARIGASNYFAPSDLNKDGRIDIFDLVLVGLAFGTSL